MEKGQKKDKSSGHKQEAVPDEKLLADVADDLQDADLLDRVDDLEGEIDDVEPDIGLADPREGGGFFSVVRELEEEIDATLALKDSLESDLETAREKLPPVRQTKTRLPPRVQRRMRTQLAVDGGQAHPRIGVGCVKPFEENLRRSGRLDHQRRGTECRVVVEYPG